MKPPQLAIVRSCEWIDLNLYRLAMDAWASRRGDLDKLVRSFASDSVACVFNVSTQLYRCDKDA